MARRGAVAIALLLALSACEAREVDTEGNLVEPAPQQASACTSEQFEDTPLTHCTADPALHSIHLVNHDSSGKPFGRMDAVAAARPADAPRVAFAVNGGMYDPEGAAVGYYVEEGERLHGLNRNEGPGNFHLLPNGVFFGNAASGWQVLSTQAFADTVKDRPDFGTQSGPMLVIDGELHPAFDADGESLAVRNGVGVDAAGRAHFVISEAPISFGKFARYFRDVLNTRNALFLDGNVSQLWDPARGRMDSDRRIGPVIVVERRTDPGE